jgi:multidrug transporter EmrE-like cation transporter
MKLSIFATILCGVLLNAVAQLFIKAGTKSFADLNLIENGYLSTFFQIAFNLNIVAGLSCYVISVGIWIYVLSKVDVSIAYPMLSIGYVVNALAAWFLFNEPLSMSKILGIGIILVGTYVISN